MNKQMIQLLNGDLVAFTLWGSAAILIGMVFANARLKTWGRKVMNGKIPCRKN